MKKRFYYRYKNGEIEGFIGEGKTETECKRSVEEIIIKSLENYYGSGSLGEQCEFFNDKKLFEENNSLDLLDEKEKIILDKDWNNSFIMFKDLLKKSFIQSIIDEVINLFPESDKQEITLNYKKLYFYMLNKVEGKDSFPKILIDIQEEKYEDEIDYDISGIARGLEEKYSLYTEKIENWLNFRIDEQQVNEIGINKYIAICLSEVSSISFFEEDKQNFIEIIEDKVDYVEKVANEKKKENQKNKFIVIK